MNAFNDRDRETLSECLAEDVGKHGIHEELHGVDEILEFLQAQFDAFPDYSGSTEAIIAEDDQITEIWLEEDRLGLLERLEVVDPPAHLRI